MYESHKLVHELLSQIVETVDHLQALEDDRLGESCSHVCAMGGDLRKLLIHNIEHERMHTGAISTARFEHDQLPDSESAALIREWLRQRVEVIGLLLGAPDEVLNLRPEGSEWSVREQAQHLLYWERDSIAAVESEHLKTTRNTST